MYTVVEKEKQWKENKIRNLLTYKEKGLWLWVTTNSLSQGRASHLSIKNRSVKAAGVINDSSFLWHRDFHHMSCTHTAFYYFTCSTRAQAYSCWWWSCPPQGLAFVICASGYFQMLLRLTQQAENSFRISDYSTKWALMLHQKERKQGWLH